MYKYLYNTTLTYYLVLILPSGKVHDWNATRVVNEAAYNKRKLYTSWDIPAVDTMPLSFSSLGKYKEGTLSYFKELSLAKGEASGKLALSALLLVSLWAIHVFMSLVFWHMML